jgi:GT2 family glycosyltransferase
MKFPTVDVILLNWNGLTDTVQCLQSLRRIDYPSWRVIVVDNGSTDGSPDIIRRQFPEVTMIENIENLGYAGGNNAGILHSLKDGTNYVLLLNNDTEVAPDFLTLLVEAAESDSSIGVTGPLIYYHEQPDIVWSAGGEVDRLWRTRMIGLNETDLGQFGQTPREVNFVTGCTMLVKNNVLHQVGILDERFFTYFEEAEWCMRIKRSGFIIINVPTAKVWHKISLVSRNNSPLVHSYMTRNRLLFLKECGAGPIAWLNTILAEYSRTLLSWSVRPKWRNKNLHRNMMLHAIRDAALGRWGRCPTNYFQ